MKALMIVLALAISPAGKIVCQVTCASEATPQQLQVPSCHERDGMQDGPLLKISGTCQHSDVQLLAIEATAHFQVLAPSVHRCSAAVFIARSLHTIEAAAARSISPPPLVLSLRI